MACREATPGNRATTLRGYEWLIRQHIRPALGHIRLDKLAPSDLRHLVEQKRLVFTTHLGGPLEPPSVNRA